MLSEITQQLTNLQARIGAWARVKGFAEGKSVDISRKLMLIVTEVAEAHDEIRSGHKPEEIYSSVQAGYPNHGEVKPEGFGIELADIVIRTFQLADDLELPLGELIEMKLDYNDTRPHKHGRQF